MTLSDLPTELVYRIAECLAPVPAEAPEEKVFSNRAMRARRPLENLASLIALSETCWIVRAAVGPLLFRRVKLTNRKHMKDIAESAWDLDVQ